MFVIITDGQENSSCEFTIEEIKSQIEHQKTKYGWEFIFLGANIDAVATARNFGINADRAQNYHADSAGIRLNFTAVSNAVETFRERSIVQEDWNREIQEDYKRRFKEQ